jgi:hypothetical protein
VTVVSNFDVYPDAHGGRGGERFSLWDEIDIDFARHDHSDALSNASATSRVCGAFEPIHRDRAFLEECPAGVGERNLTAGTKEERDAQIDLQFRNRPREWGKSHIQPLCGTAKMEFFGNGQEIAQGPTIKGFCRTSTHVSSLEDEAGSRRIRRKSRTQVG